MTTAAPEPEGVAPCRYRLENIAGTAGKPTRVAPEEHVRFWARGHVWCHACDMETPASVAARTDVRR